MAAKGSKGLLFLRTEVLCTVILDKVFKNEPSKICERQPLPANYLKAVIFIGQYILVLWRFLFFTQCIMNLSTHDELLLMTNKYIVAWVHLYSSVINFRGGTLSYFGDNFSQLYLIIRKQSTQNTSTFLNFNHFTLIPFFQTSQYLGT